MFHVKHFRQGFNEIVSRETFSEKHRLPLTLPVVYLGIRMVSKISWSESCR